MIRSVPGAFGRYFARRKMRWAVRWWANLDSGDRACLIASRHKAQQLHLMDIHRRDLEAMRYFERVA